MLCDVWTLTFIAVSWHYFSAAEAGVQCCVVSCWLLGSSEVQLLFSHM